MHDDDLPVDEALVSRLVADRLPELAPLPVTRLPASGSTNALFRLGHDLLVRLPRQPGGSETILKEARWSPLVGGALPVPTPYVVAVGDPAHGYPEHWSVVGWLPGENPVVGRTPTTALVTDLAAAVRGLRELDVPDQALDDPALRWYRAEPLAGIDEDFQIAVAECRSLPDLDLDLDAALQVWDEALALDAADPGVHWLHGDLLAENVLVRDGRLSAVLDLGGLAVGDPTVDLVVAWELLDAAGRERFRALVDVDDAPWLRGRAWALAIAMLTFPYYGSSMPQRCASRLVMARSVLADAGIQSS